MPEAAIAAIAATLAGGPQQDSGVGVWPEHVEIVAAFLCCASQWRTASIGGGLAPTRPMFIGLDYASARVGIEAAGIAITPRLWGGLRVMEAAAREALNGFRA
jgi:uncharacterized protein DUF1799